MKAYHDSVNHFEKSLRSSGKSPSTIESYCRDANDFLNFLEDHSIHIDDVEAESLFQYQAILNDREKENSIRRKIIGIRQFFRFLSDQSRSFSSPLDHVPIPERDESLPDILDEVDIDEILAVLKTRLLTLKGNRDLAIFYLLAFEGLKATEVIHLKWEQLLLGAKTGTLTFYGPKSRTIELSASSYQALANYKLAYEKKIEDFKFDKNHLFVSFKGRDASTTLPKMTRHGLKFLLYELGESIGLRHLNTELVRHYAMQFQLRQGKTPTEVMAHFGLKRLGNIAKHAHIRRLESKEPI